MKPIKRTVCIFFALLMMLSILPAQPADAAFGDVSRSSSYYKAVTYLTNIGVISGYTNGNFGLTDSIKREDMVTLLWRIAGEPTVSGVSNFTDNKDTTKYYYKAIRWAQKTGVTNGVGNNKFGIGSLLTNEQTMQFIYNFATKVVKRSSTISNPLGASIAETRIKSYADWAKTAARWAYRNKIATLSYVHDANCTRGDVALMLYNYYKQYQRRFAFVGTGTDDMGIGSVALTTDYVNLFSKKFSVPEGNIHTKKVDSQTAFQTAIDTAFGTATCIDKCYIYFHAHGRAEGLNLNRKGNVTPSAEATLSPDELYSMLDKKEGMFTVMLEACRCGVFVEYFKRNGYRYNLNLDIITGTSAAQNSACMTVDGKTRAIASYCWLKALENSIPDSTNPYTFSEDKATYDLVLNGQGNGDGYISMQELCNATKNAINACRAGTANPSSEYQTCLYHSTRVKNVAFGTP